MLLNIRNLSGRKFENTRLVNLEILANLGVLADFYNLTKRVGFKTKFWKLDHKTHSRTTMEFLASLELKTDPNDGEHYIKFRLNNETSRLQMKHLRDIFGFDANPDMRDTKFRTGWNKEKFWRKITGLGEPKGYKARFIQHPSLRIIQRVLVATIFARGETVTQCNNEELMLMDTMLREPTEKPDLAYLMVKNWIRVRNQPRSGGNITMGAYVSRLAKKFNMNLPNDDICKNPHVITPQLLSSAQFLKVQRDDNGNEIYLWQMEDRVAFHLPYEQPVVPTDQRSWLVSSEYSATLPDRHEEAGPSHAAPTQGMSSQPPEYWYNHMQGTLDKLLDLSISHGDDMRAARDEIREIRRLSEDNSQLLEQFGNEFRRMDSRLDTMDQTQYNQQFYLDYGYWPGGDDDPNLHGGDGDYF